MKLEWSVLTHGIVRDLDEALERSAFEPCNGNRLASDVESSKPGSLST